ncbi:pentatricopeptide repeat-containing protein [Tanacetum coccineum]
MTRILYYFTFYVEKDKADVVRTEPIFKDNKGHMYCRLKGCSANPGILLQDIGTEYAHGFLHDEKTYGVIVMKLLYANEFRRAEDIVERMRKDECKVTDDIFLVMCRAYGRMHKPHDVMRIFQKMKEYECEPTLKAYITVFSILVNENQLKVALKFYRYMRQLGFPPNVPSLNVLIKALSKNSGTMDSAIQIFREMPNHGCIPDMYMYGSLINGLCRLGKISEANELWTPAIHKVLHTLIIVVTSAVIRLTISFVDDALIPISYDDDEDDTIAIIPVLPIEKPDNSLSMGDEHLDTIPATESDEVIKSSVEDLVPIPSESEGIPDNMCDVPLCENTTPLNALNEHSEIVVNSNDDNSSSDDDSPYGEDIDYVDASPPDVEIVSLEVVEIVNPEVERIDDDILLTIKDDTLREKLLNVNLLIAKIDALRNNPTLSFDVVIKSTSTFSNPFLEETNTFDNSIPESKTFRFNLEDFPDCEDSRFYHSLELHILSFILGIRYPNLID